MKKIIITAALFILIPCIVKAQAVHWDNSSRWTIYNVRSSHAFFWPEDTLKNFTSLSLEDSTIHALLTKTVM
ncbi:MAG: hypothetical protein JST96_17590, partial [Bacteroidetes bacterium]|nr:hypothetical protein [Bacteroidota bacterium]